LFRNLERFFELTTGGTDGPWLIQQPTAPGLPETMFGAPVVVDNNILASGSAVREIAYGSFEKGCIIHNAGLRFEASYERYFENDATAYRLIFRADGQVQDAAAYGIYKCTAYLAVWAGV
jgi:HK97 family phage major capsid protein